MEADFWHQRWQSNQIAFHQDRFNPHLDRCWWQLGIAAGCVFVPLCGKSLDMLWFVEQGFSVLGIELSSIAVRDFFVENDLPCSTTHEDRFERWQSDQVQVLLGDFFDLRAERLQHVSAVYDRASLIAMPPAGRVRYVEHLAAVAPPGTPMLLIGLEYDEREMAGPPFSVTESEVRRLYAGRYLIERLWSRDVLDKATRFRDKGLSWLVETVYLLSPAHHGGA